MHPKSEFRWIEPGRLLAIRVTDEDNPSHVEDVRIEVPHGASSEQISAIVERRVEEAQARLEQRSKSQFSGIDRTATSWSLQNIAEHPDMETAMLAGIEAIMRSGRGDPR